MDRGVKKTSPLWDARKAETERKILDAATRLFVADGYAATSLAAVAEAAAVGARTVYLRFGSKAELLKRAIDVALVGDTEEVDLAHRDWYVRAATAPTLEERIAGYARGAREVMERAAPLIAVAAAAEAGEPLIAQDARTGRTATQRNIADLWRRMHADGLLHPDADLEWIITTAGTLAQAETYNLMIRTLDWDPATYQQWLYGTWLRFATTPSTLIEPSPGPHEPDDERA
ncbi:TetR/AcrR family transcriptional regulator [Nocardia sp. BMG111209]|uniref:TetR/AcrR family transcriptional regulator n=1 Tax=Nocardia sp. BMG111209 TaxID=1160137 RepID=UPI0003745595|nr:TetR/AcrR family transcriptional regulator [Nocardia sp. BMG111209]